MFPRMSTAARPVLRTFETLEQRDCPTAGFGSALGVFEGGNWRFDDDLDGQFDAGFRFDRPGKPLAADWDGDGVVDLILVDRGRWSIDTDRDGRADVDYVFGSAGGDSQPALIDWNGDSAADPVSYDTGGVASRWLVDSDRDGRADHTVAFGQPGDLPFVTDWDRDGRADLGLFRDGASTGGPPFMQFFVDTGRDGGFADAEVWYGTPGDRPLTLDRIGADPVPALVRFEGGDARFFADSGRDGGVAEHEFWLRGVRPTAVPLTAPFGTVPRPEIRPVQAIAFTPDLIPAFPGDAPLALLDGSTYGPWSPDTPRTLSDTSLRPASRPAQARTTGRATALRPLSALRPPPALQVGSPVVDLALQGGFGLL